MRTGSRVMIEVAARSGQFPEPLRYPPRSSLLAWHEGNRHGRLSSAHEANVLKIADKGRKHAKVETLPNGTEPHPEPFGAR